VSVATSIANALVRFGRPMTLTRPGGATVTVYGTLDGSIAQKLGLNVAQNESVVVFSNSEIAAASWPGPPSKLDTMVIDTRKRTIQSVESKYLGTEVLVHVCRILG
jgi:hypothetical protein